MKVLPGTWAIIDNQEGQQGQLSLPNIIQRTGEITGVKQWREVQFMPNGSLRLIGEGNVSALLNYHVEGNQIHIAPQGPLIEHDAFEADLAGGMLYLRSLEDAQTLMLAPTAALAHGPSASARPAARQVSSAAAQPGVSGLGTRHPPEEQRRTAQPAATAPAGQTTIPDNQQR
jgi:hypothetical protein